MKTYDLTVGMESIAGRPMMTPVEDPKTGALVYRDAEKRIVDMEQLTFQRAIGAALLNDDWKGSPDQKYHRWQIAQRIEKKPAKVPLEKKEIDVILTGVAELYGAKVYGPVKDLLAPEADEVAAEADANAD